MENSRKEGRPEKAAVYAPSEIAVLFKRAADRGLLRGPLEGTLWLEGTLGPLPSTSGDKYVFGVPLTDAEGGSVKINLPKALEGRARALQGRSVRVSGYLEPRVRQTSVIFNVYARVLEPVLTGLPRGGHARADEVEAGRGNLYALLKGHRCRHRSFPERWPLRVRVVHPKSATAKHDVQLGLQKLPEGVARPEYVSADFSRPDGVRTAIEGSRGADVLILTRGGGEAGELAVLDDAGVVEAFLASDSYRISAVGHATDTVLLDHLADASLPTPTAAGAFVLERLRQTQDRRRSRSHPASDLESARAQHRDEMEDLRDRHREEEEEIRREAAAEAEGRVERDAVWWGERCEGMERSARTYRLLFFLAAAAAALSLVWAVVFSG